MPEEDYDKEWLEALTIIKNVYTLELNNGFITETEFINKCSYAGSTLGVLAALEYKLIMPAELPSYVKS